MKNLIYLYNELDFEEPIEITEEDILHQYWDTWYLLMARKYGKDHKLITNENCIKDWLDIHWAWEKKND